MKVQEEILAQLEDMMYNYVQGEVSNCEKELEEIFKFCVDSYEPPKKKVKKSCNFKPGDLLIGKIHGEEFLFLEKLPNTLLLCFNISTKSKGTVFESSVEKAKPKQVVLSAPELIAVLESDGYQFKQGINGLGWINTKEALPNFFNVEMLHYCGKEPDTENWNWNPRWLK